MMAEQGVQMRELSKVNPERISLVVARNIIYSKKIVQILAKTHRVSAYVQYTIGAQGYAVILSKVALTALLLEILECLKNQPQMSNALNQIGYS